MNISVGNLVLPNKPLSNIELLEAARKLKIPNFRGVSLRDILPKKPKKKECGILNLDDTTGLGTHWVAWYKNGTEKKYFDSYGLQPPNELVDYLTPKAHATPVHSPILYNTERVQPYDQVFCGHLCLYVLKQLGGGQHLQDIINSLY